MASPIYKLNELVYHIQDSHPKIFVVGKPVFEVSKQAAIKCGITDNNIYIMEEDNYQQYKSIWSLAGEEELEPRRLSHWKSNSVWLLCAILRAPLASPKEV